MTLTKVSMGTRSSVFIIANKICFSIVKDKTLKLGTNTFSRVTTKSYLKGGDSTKQLKDLEILLALVAFCLFLTLLLSALK